MDYARYAGDENPESGGQSNSHDLRKIIADRIEHLRARLLDSSRRNPLIQVPFRQNSSSLIRFVDELPDVLAERLANRVPMRLVALPAIDEALPDEQTDEFLEAFDIARSTDTSFLEASSALDPTDADYAQKEIDLERALKDRIREDLDLPERQTDESPSLAVHARNHGISPDYVLPLPSEVHGDGRHEDADIQTLLLPERLERVGRSLHDRGHAYERETGVNVLHAAFGILEWNEPGSARAPALSPLLLLEIRMTREKSPAGARYRICGENELTLNTTLAQTLSAQFGLELPPYRGGSIERYLGSILEIAPAGWQWAVRREALAGVFPSSRIAMYRDIDPATSAVADNPVIGSMLGTAGGDGSAYADVYDTDDPAIEKRVPHLVMDADASQFSSLVDAANGGNIAIEGPPGSGKSQTIVNLIASAMADGKKVLFVAEKLTALDVVRNRLDAAGLGEFVLPLQAGRGSRDAVFKSLDERLAMERPPHGAAEAHRARHDALVHRRGEMQTYLAMLGAQAGQSGMSVHEALGRAIATAGHLEGLPREIRRLRLPAADQIDRDGRREIEGDARMVVDRLAAADRIAALWNDAGRGPLRPDEAEDIAAEIGALARDIDALRADTEDSILRPLLPVDILITSEITTNTTLSVIMDNLGCDPDLVENLLEPPARRAAEEICDARDRSEAARRILETLLDNPDSGDLDQLLATAHQIASRHGNALDPRHMAETIATLQAHCANLSDCRDRATALPARWAETAQEDGTTLRDLALDVDMILRAPDAVLARRQPDDSRTMPPVARDAAARQRQLAGELDTIRQTLPAAGDHAHREILAAAASIEDAGLFRVFSGTFKKAWRLYRDELGGDAKVSRAQAAANLLAYAAWIEKREAFAGDQRFTARLAPAFQGLQSDPELLEAIASFHDTAFRVSRGDERLRYALETASLDPLWSFAKATDVPSVTLAQLGHEIAEAERALQDAREDRRLAAEICLAFRRSERVDMAAIETALEARLELEDTASQIADSPAAGIVDHALSTEAVRAAIVVAERMLFLPNTDIGPSLLRSGRAPECVAAAPAFFARLNALRSNAASIASEIALRGVNEEEGATALEIMGGRIDDLRDAATRPEGLVERARLLRALAALEARGLGELTDWIQSPEGLARRDALPDITAALLARSLTDCVEATFGRTLDARDGADLDRLRREIAKTDREMIALSRHAIREGLLERSNPPRGTGTGKVGTFTEMSLIRHEIGKVRNRIGVRDLTTRAGHALIDLKPCWMMSPLAVAQYLDGSFMFDLVVIDEASQMTPENALGALMRARQVVIVGDTKQLPPTNFFSTTLDDADEDENVRTDSESILDMANTTFTPVRQLRWHYRSRHPALITISNKMIYDEQLTIFPAARDGDPALGVHLVEVEGEYRKGRNIPEARAIVAGAIEHMRDHPDRSLGLATMNKDQTELILSEFERERARNPHVEAFIERWAEKDDGLEEFFVKNLETIQGDERDVIMISTLYGPDAQTGKVYQRFGPVNSVHGHRRLNVLFSRAKEKMVTYTSMKPTDIQADGKAHGVVMLRAWLEFSRTGKMTDAQSGRAQTESPFEDFVISQVEAAGYEAVPQVGASGYRIDIGVRHPDFPYGFILAVECDGAPYHSSRSSRDRDRLRQQVLEGLGWRFHRIWSTDWFRDPRAQIDRLRAALDESLERAVREEAHRQQERAYAVERARRVAQDAEAHAARLEERAWSEAAPEGAAPVAVPAAADLQPASDVDLSDADAAAETRTDVDRPADPADAKPSAASLSQQALIRMEESLEARDYEVFNRTATTRKRGFYWIGFLEGVAASNGIENGEAEALLNEARDVDRFFDLPDQSIADGLAEALHAADGDLMTAIDLHAKAIADSLDDPERNAPKDTVNTFLGFCAGIICDGLITAEEARKIRDRFHANPELEDAPIFANLRWAIDGALADSVLDDDEAEEIRDWISALVTDGHADTGVANIGGVVSPTDPITEAGDISFDGKSFVLTGKMSIGPRSLIGSALEERGAILKSSVGPKVDFVVVSNTASRHWKTTHFGTKIEAARGYIEEGHPMRFVVEKALADALSGKGLPNAPEALDTVE